MNDKQLQFCREYVVDFNATQAAIRAGYSSRTAGAMGHELLKKPEIEAEVKRLTLLKAEETGLTPNRVLEEISRIALSDLRGALSWGMKDVSVCLDVEGKVVSPDDEAVAKTVTHHVPYLILKNSDELTPAQAAAIKSIKISEKGEVAIQFHDKVAALDKAARHLGLYAAEDERAATGFAEALAAAMKRGKG